MWGLSSEKWHFVLEKIRVDTVQCEAGTVRIDFAMVQKWCLLLYNTGSEINFLIWAPTGEQV